MMRIRTTREGTIWGGTVYVGGSPPRAIVSLRGAYSILTNEAALSPHEFAALLDDMRKEAPEIPTFKAISVITPRDSYDLGILSGDFSAIVGAITNATLSPRFRAVQAVAAEVHRIAVERGVAQLTDAQRYDLLRQALTGPEQMTN